MSHDPLPVLWLCGPPGSGKTTVAWEIYSQLARSGTPVGYVDIDQLGICYPEPPADPGRYRMKADNLDAVVAGYRAAGARCVVVSGVVDPVHGVHAKRVPHASLTMCRLRADDDELRRRIVAREGSDAAVADALAEAAAYEAENFADIRVDTTGRTVAEVVTLVQEHTAPWPADHPGIRHGMAPRRDAPTLPTETTPTAEAYDAPILWLCGATGVGKSTVGFSTYLRIRAQSDFPGAYVDLDQLGFVSPPPVGDPANHHVKARNLAAMWRRFRRAGARHVTVVGPAESAEVITVYARQLGTSALIVCRLHAGRETLTRRLLLRGEGRGWAQPGDPLRGLSAADLREIADSAAAHAHALDRHGVGHLRVDTDERDVAEIAEEIVARTRWSSNRRVHAPDRPGAGSAR